MDKNQPSIYAKIKDSQLDIVIMYGVERVGENI